MVNRKGSKEDQPTINTKNQTLKYTCVWGGGALTLIKTAVND